VEQVVADQKELKSQEAWIMSKKGHGQLFSSKESRNRWLEAEVDKMEEQLASLEVELEEVTKVEKEKQEMLASTAAIHQAKSEELKKVQMR
jgi:hypothetical protein